MRSKRGFPSHVKVSALPYQGIFGFPVGKVTPGGTDYRFLTALSFILDFNFKIVSPEDGEWGKEMDNGSWTGMIGMVNRGDADMALCAIFVTKQRLKVVDFSWPYMHTDQTFATNLPRRLPIEYAFLYPFDHITWILVGVMLFALPIVIYMISRGRYSLMKAFFDVYGSLLMKAFFDVYGSLLMKNLSKNWDCNNALLIFSPAWLFCTWIISLSYMSILPAFLVTPLFETPIKDFRILADAVTSGQCKTYAYKGSPQVPLMLEAGIDHLRVIAQAMNRENWFFGPAEEHLKKGTVHIEGRLYLELEYGSPPDSPVFISDDAYGSNTVAIAIGKNFCCKKQLNSAILSVIETGLFNKYITDEIFMAKLKFLSHKNFDGDGYFKQMSFTDVSAAFMVLFMGLVLSFVVFLLEICVPYTLHSCKAYVHLK